MPARSLTNVRIKVEGLPVQLCDPETLGEAGALHSSHGEVTPELVFIRERDGASRPWLLVEGSKFGGLPVNGEQESWWAAWDNLQIEVLLLTAGRWDPIDDWSQLTGVVRDK